jgi:catechol 2,3-dioxygenase-like lactoylglutathione lyase family enzyme
MKVDFQHLGLSITAEADIREFYQNILGLKIQKEFVLKRELARKLFRQDREIKVIAGNIGNLYVELFLIDADHQPVCEHICLISENRNRLVSACQTSKYPVTIIKREPFDFVFIRDNSGNLFEIKEVQK